MLLCLNYKEKQIAQGEMTLSRGS